MTTKFGLEGKVAFCTGSGRSGGLGAAILQRLADEGCRVVVSDIGTADDRLGSRNLGSSDEMEKVAEELRRSGAEVLCVPLDVRDESQVETAVAATVEAFGQLDIMINNAGIGFMMEPLVDMSRERWQAVLDVNLMGAFLCTKHAARQMIRQGKGGRIVNIASQAAKSGHLHLAAYSSSKHGMVGLTRSAAIELGPNAITVNAVCPNHVTTGLGAVQNEYFARLRGFESVDAYLQDMRNRIPLRRTGMPGDTADAVTFLCSDAAQYITGEALNVSGGIEMH
jgi:meso-butanediol dehydrogenase/(S,S)-butanediol dehydrogenase/diacetyl reductase